MYTLMSGARVKNITCFCALATHVSTRGLALLEYILKIDVTLSFVILLENVGNDNVFLFTLPTTVDNS